MEKYRRHWNKPDNFIYLVFYDSFSNINSAYHCHDFYEFLLMLDGEIIHNVNSVQQILSKGDLVFIRPDDYHAFFQHGEACKYLNLGFSKSTMVHFCNFIGLDLETDKIYTTKNPPIKKLSTYQLESFLKKVDPLKYAFATNYEKTINIEFKQVLFNMLSLFVKEHKESISAQEPKWLTILMEEMHLPKYFSKGVSEMMHLTGFSSEYIARTFKKHYKMTPIQFLTNVRMNYASNLLKYSNEEIVIISENCGFDSLSHFYRVFKKYKGISPAKYRVENKESFFI